MPITTLDPHIALLSIDLQSGTAANAMAHPIDDIVARAADLAAAFRTAGLPVVIVTAGSLPPGRTAYSDSPRALPDGWATPLPEMTPSEDDLTVIKGTWSAFVGTDLDAQLRSLGVTQVVILGLATSFGVESTARSAYDLGYHVLLAVDAMTDPSVDAHQLRLERVFPTMGQTATTAQIRELLLDRSATK